MKQGFSTSDGAAGRVTAQIHISTAAAAADSGGSLTREEFADRYERSWRILWCAAVAIVRDRTSAQDLVQQAAVVGLEHLKDFEPGTNFVSWMVRIVRNLALNEARRGVRQRTSATDPLTLDGPALIRSANGLSTGSAMQDDVGVLTGAGQLRSDQTQFDDSMMVALGKLEETARACLLMRAVLSLSYKEIGLALGVPEGTAASHVHRARSAMRLHLADAACSDGRIDQANRGGGS